VIPGGAKGAETMSRDGGVQKLVRDYLSHGKYVGMVCAGKCVRIPDSKFRSKKKKGVWLQKLRGYPLNP
jgi:hypothetical protein